ncbi:GNAT family N-acetyltransferase [Antarctobacter heliothermus]|uniref:Ribosomal protein S18 acetylase RimI n=1 Tax=Antarctobacter heliothermus TaxID=74033 RepID=A0A239HVR1_9RHOB|nr:GNAT family N-acetyltransferase [Antarctobacter heliothermus]SNS85409.1 Ribosomal protein S18 acetylase RimI [Antarctobacter heliothermus]
MSLILRPVRAADRAFLLQLFIQVRPDLAALPLPVEARQHMIDMQFDAQDRGYADGFPHASHDIVVAGGQDVGQMRVDRGAKAIHLIDVSVLVAAQGRGLGTSLLHQLRDEATRAGLPIRLSVQHGNRAVDLYRRSGFMVTGDSGVHLVMEWRPAGLAPS